MSRPCLLIGERDPFIQHTLKQVLKEHYALSFVTDGAALVAQARAKPPDAIILEIMLPTLDGFQVCRQLKHDSRTQPIPILVYSLLAAEARALQAGADAFLQKPQPTDKLLSTILGLLKAQPARQESRASQQDTSHIGATPVPKLASERSE